MNMLWPGFLVLFGLIPLILLGYLWMLRRRRRYVVRYSSLSLVREAQPHQSRLRRHLPFALFLLALTSLVIAMGRPITVATVPAGQSTIILAMDVSRSMLQRDIAPSRLEAAEDAARSFIQRQNPNTQIGIVVFAGFAQLIQPPTEDSRALQSVIGSMTAGRGTAIGSGILESLDAIAEVNDAALGFPSSPVTDGTYAPEIIVLLTDGVSTTGPMPLEAAQQAVERGIRVYTIGFGTENDASWFGQPSDNDSSRNGQQGNRPRFRRGIDEETLKAIAEMTGGEYFYATNANELQAVFDSLPMTLQTKEETTEISFAFTALGALLAATAILLALLWHPLP